MFNPEFTPENGDEWIRKHPNDLQNLELITFHKKFTSDGAITLLRNLETQSKRTLSIKESGTIREILKNLQNSNIGKHH